MIDLAPGVPRLKRFTVTDRDAAEAEKSARAAARAGGFAVRRVAGLKRPAGPGSPFEVTLLVVARSKGEADMADEATPSSDGDAA